MRPRARPPSASGSDSRGFSVRRSSTRAATATPPGIRSSTANGRRSKQRSSAGSTREISTAREASGSRCRISRASAHYHAEELVRWRLSPPERRLALLHESGHAFEMILRRRGGRETLGLAVRVLVPGMIERGADQALGKPERDGRAVRERWGELFRDRTQAGARKLAEGPTVALGLAKRL